MALGTPSIDTLRTNRLEALRKRGIDSPEQSDVRARLDAMRDGVRATTEALLSDLRTLDALDAGDDQIAEYGEKRWHDEFMAVGDGDPELHVKPLGNSRFGRVQRLLAKPSKWAKPRMPRGDLDTMSLRGIVVSPDLVPDKALVDLGLVDAETFEHFRGEPVARLGVKRAAKDGLLMALESAAPLDAKERRIVRVEPTSDRARSHYPEGTPETRERAHGGILYTRERVTGRKGPRQLQMQYFDSAYAALRKTAHEDASYTRELDTVVRCQADLKRTIDTLNEEYRANATAERKQELREEAESVARRYNAALQACIDRHKVEAREFLLNASDLRDKSKKVNPSSAMAKMTAAISRMTKRFDEMKSKGGFNAHDRMILHSQITREENAMLDSRRSIRDLAVSVESGYRRPDGAVEPLRANVRELEKVRLRPLRGPATAMIRQLQSLTPEDGDAFADQLVTLHVLGKLQGLASALEWIPGDIAKNGRVDAARITDYVRRVEEAFAGRQIFAAVTPPKLEAIMEPLCERLQALRAYAERCCGGAGTDEAEVRATLEEHIAGFDIDNAVEAIADGLPAAVPYAPPYILTNNR